MRLEDLDYDLPEELIAQHPPARRGESRLLVVERATGALHDCVFTDLPQWLRRGDALVLNETRVRPARLSASRPSGGRVELLFVRPEPGASETWRVLARPARHLTPGVRLAVPASKVEIEVLATGDGGERVVQLAGGDLAGLLAAHGEIPLPPYIRRDPTDEDRDRYQTVFARVDGAVAAPTAGLHFTDEILSELVRGGVDPVSLVLHVGPGTFRPISDADPTRHRMDEEWFELDDHAARRLRDARQAGGRLVAVGTTSVRALESACDAGGGQLGPARGWTRKFIVPPYRFQAVDALITNFHLPRTTLLLLVGALTGQELLREAYAHAVQSRYRFYSYGDAMLVI